MTPRAGALRQDVPARVAELVRNGRVEELIGMRRELKAWAESHRDPQDPRVVQARAGWALAALIMIDTKDAADALKPYLPSGKSRGLVGEGPATGRFKADHGKGVILTMVANLRYREFRYEEASRIAEIATTHLQYAPAETELDGLLARSQNSIWRARILWHCRKPREAKSLLGETLGELALQLGRGGEVRGTELLAATAYGLWAQWDWRGGHLGKAKEKCYHALFLLSRLTGEDGEPVAPVRLGQMLLAAGQIERANTQRELRWATHLLRQSAALFAQAGHPFEARARIELARCYSSVDSGEERELELAKTADLCAALKATNPGESAVVQGDLILTRLWDLEDLARSGAPGGWQRCAEFVQQLQSIGAKPGRFDLEYEIHAALARTMAGKSRSEGTQALEAAAKKALSKENRKLAIAAQLALAEITLENDLPRARAFWTEASRLLETIENASLSSWKERLAVRLGTGFSFSIDPDLTLKEAQQEFTRQLLQYHLARNGTTAELMEVLGLSHAHVYRLLGKHGLDTKGGATRRRSPAG